MKEKAIFLKENRNILRDILDSVDEGVLVSDAQGRIVLYNKALEALENKKAQEMIGQYLWDAYGYKDSQESEHVRVRTSGGPILQRYSAHSYEGDQPRFLSYSTWPLYEEGEIVGVFSVCRNEEYLKDLLYDTIELRRRHQSSGSHMHREVKPNGTQFTFSDIVGSSSKMKKLIQEAQAIAWLDNPVLIIGATGTGKEVFAQSIHNHGRRGSEPFIAIDCSAIPENLMESIFFGTVKGAFTGAENHIGIFEQAGKGTIFLDELNSMPLSMQAKLLRALQEKQVRRIGDTHTRPFFCRIISAMNQDPRNLIEENKFRQDLFYRISGFHLFIPAIKERKEDIIALAEYFIRCYAPDMDRQTIGVTKELKKVLDHYPWPGNTRELEHLMENMLLRSEKDQQYLGIQNIPEYLKGTLLSESQKTEVEFQESTLPQVLLKVEKQMIQEELEKNRYNITKTAKALGIIRQSLLYRMKKLGIEKI